VSDARRAGDIGKAYELVAETMKIFGNSAYGKPVTNEEKIASSTDCNEDKISIKKNSPHQTDCEQLFSLFPPKNINLRCVLGAFNLIFIFNIYTGDNLAYFL
jgi:hypothetical protein